MRAQRGNTLFQIVIGGRQECGLTLVASRAVCSGQSVKALEKFSRVRHVATNRRIAPLRIAVTVKTQVKSNQVRHGIGRGLVETQGLHALARHLCTHQFMMVERDRAIGFEAPRGRLTDVVHEGSKTQDKVRLGNRAIRVGLQVDRLIQDGERVLIDVLVPIVLINC